MLVELDGRFMTDRASTHDYLQEKLSFPDYYGRNLDALYDILCECKNVHIRFEHEFEMRSQLGAYADMLISTLQEAADNNPAITFEINSGI